MPFVDKWHNAQAAGAGAIVLDQRGQPGPDRVDPQWFDVEGAGVEIPMVAAQVATVERLAGGVAQGLVGKTARFRVDWRPGTYPTRNVIAETHSGDPDKVIVVGAHLDSVGTGPGINDNGSGSAGILEIAEQLGGVRPQNKIRFVWFSAEESGLLGSEAYVASLSAERAQPDRGDAQLRHDRLAQLRALRLRRRPVGLSADLRGHLRAGGAALLGHDRAAVPGLLRGARAGDGADGLRRPLGLRAVHRAPAIPAGGLFTGAEVIKTPAQAAVFGGTAGEPFDPCYHLGCDDFGNISDVALDQMSDAAAHATITLAQSDIPDRAAAPAAAARFAARAGAPSDIPDPLALGAESR